MQITLIHATLGARLFSQRDARSAVSAALSNAEYSLILHLNHTSRLRAMSGLFLVRERTNATHAQDSNMIVFAPSENSVHILR